MDLPEPGGPIINPLCPIKNHVRSIGMTKRLAFSYIRMSTEAQLKGHSLERQLNITRAYAAENGFTLIDDIRDIGLSAHDGSHVAKGKFGEFMAALKAGTIPKGSALLVENLDRLSRQTPVEALGQLIDLVNYGIEVHTIFDRQIYSLQSMAQPAQLFISLAGIIKAHGESKDKAERLSRAWKGKREKVRLRILTSLCPAWLKPNGARTSFELIPERADIVRKIFDLCIDQGMGVFSIAGHLNADPAHYPSFSDQAKRRRTSRPSPRVAWYKSYILKILKNPAVYGEFMLHKMDGGMRRSTGEIVDNYFPQVVTKERFLLAQARLQGRKMVGGGRKGDDFRNLFTKLLTCGDCGSTIGFHNKGRKPKGGMYLRCVRAASKGGGCDCGGWRYSEFENAFFQFTTGVDFGPALSQGTDKSKRDILLEQREIAALRVESIQGSFDTVLNLQPGLSKAALRPVQQKIESLTFELENAEAAIRAIDIELADIDRRQLPETQASIIKAVSEAQQEASPEERAALRRLLHGQITSVISHISLDGLKSSQPEEGRSFTAIFKNGHEQTVFPYEVEGEDYTAELRSLTGEKLATIDTTSFRFLGREERIAAVKPVRHKRKKANKKAAV